MKKITCILLLLHICLAPKMLWAQQDSNYIWLEATSAMVTYNFGGSAAIYKQQKNVLYGFRVLYVSPVLIGKNGSISEFSPLVGFSTSREYVSVSASAGVSLINFTSYKRIPQAGFQVFEKYEPDETRIGFGIPLQAMISMPCNHIWGLCFGITANVNYVRSYIGLLAGLQIGHIQKKKS